MKLGCDWIVTTVTSRTPGGATGVDVTTERDNRGTIVRYENGGVCHNPDIPYIGFKANAMIRRVHTLLLLCATLAIAVASAAQPSWAQTMRLPPTEPPTNNELLRRLEAAEAELAKLREQAETDTNAPKDVDAGNGDSVSAELHKPIASDPSLSEPPVLASPSVEQASLFESRFGKIVTCAATDCGQCPCGVCDGTYRPCVGAGSVCNLCKESIAWQKGDWRIVPFGRFRGEFVYSSAAQTADAVTVFLNPKNPGVAEDSSTVHAKQSQINFKLTGPSIGDWKSGGVFLMNFMGAQPLRNFSGANIVLAYGEIQNGEWRFAFGRMLDLFSPINPTTVDQLNARGAGNTGIYRGAFHVDRFITLNDCHKWTWSARIGQQDITDFAAIPQIRGTDNGWPNIEYRIGVELGKMQDFGRPFELGVSGVFGEVQAVADSIISNGNIVLARQEVEPTRGVAIDLQLDGSRFGFHSEVWYARGAGTYFAATLQSLNPDTGQAIESMGWWADMTYRARPNLLTAVGYGVDNPKNSQIGFVDPVNSGIGQISFNNAAWCNAIWNVTDWWELAIEGSYRRTKYIAADAESRAYGIRTASTFYY